MRWAYAARKFLFPYKGPPRCPYGEKTAAYIRRRARAIACTLLEKGCGIIVVACNTATAAAIRYLRGTFPDVPFIGMEPAVKPAALGTKTGVIGVLATAGTLKGSKYLTTKGKYEDDVRIEEHVGEGFVDALLPVFGRHDLVAFELEDFLERIADTPFVIDDQDLHGKYYFTV